MPRKMKKFRHRKTGAGKRHPAFALQKKACVCYNKLDYISQGGAPHAGRKTHRLPRRQGASPRLDNRLVRGGGSQAAAVLLLTGIAPPEIHLHTPGGITFCLPVEDAHMSGNAAVCTVRKDAGDDPDITNGVRITASVRRIEKGVTIEGGAGVGRITRPGLAMPVGEAAINPGPRQQIADAVHRAAQQNGYGGGFSVTISVKGRRGACRPDLQRASWHRRRHLYPRHERHCRADERKGAGRYHPA